MTNLLWREANRERARAYDKDRREAYRAVVYAAKDRPCADCGKTYPPYVMDFDHVRGEKLFNLGENGATRSLEVLQAEIDKCDVVCANCHRIRTWERRQ